MRVNHKFCKLKEEMITHKFKNLVYKIPIMSTIHNETFQHLFICYLTIILMTALLIFDMQELYSLSGKLIVGGFGYILIYQMWREK